MTNGPLTRRRMLALSALAALGTAGCARTGTPSAASATPTPTASTPVGVLAANVNQNLDAINLAELHDVSATWLRGFYLMQNTDRSGLHTLLSAGQQGIRTVLNLKFDYGQGLPAANSPALNLARQRLDAVLAVVMGQVDILVVGNEPFYECGGRTAGLNQFYETMAQQVIDYRQQHPSGKPTQIFMGALTDLDSPKPAWAPLLDRWMSFVRGNPAIAGTDCHPHVASIADGQQYPDFVVPRLRADQKFLATEFSLVKLWKAHLKDPISDEFADQYGITRGTPVWQVAGQAIAHPFPQAQWNDFLLSSPWFAHNDQGLTQLMTALRTTGRCAVAGYGITQDTGAVHDFGPTSTPWIFNSVFCPYTTQPSNGLPGQNTTWLDQFRALQQR